MNKKAVLGILIAILLPLLGYVFMKNYSDRNINMPRHYIYDSVSTQVVNGKEIVDTIWHKVPNFTLTNQLGNKVELNDIKNKVVVANFFFTRCPTICPKTTAHMKLLQDGIKSSNKVGDRTPNFVHYISFSVDPERDSVEVLKKWSDRFQINPENWWLLTGPKKEIYDLSIKDLKVGVQDGQQVDSNFIHTDYFVLIDKNQHIRGYYHGLDTSAIQQLSQDIIFLALEKDPNKKSPFSGNSSVILLALALAAGGVALLWFLFKKENK